MVSQQVLFAETIAGMKKALKRKAYGEKSMVNSLFAALWLNLAAPQSPTPTPR